MKITFLALLIMASCIPMEQKGKLTFRDLRQEEIDEMERRQEAIRQAEVARLELQR